MLVVLEVADWGEGDGGGGGRGGGGGGGGFIIIVNEWLVKHP